jgi:hypothetical protein
MWMLDRIEAGSEVWLQLFMAWQTSPFYPEALFGCHPVSLSARISRAGIGQYSEPYH